jgi:hypothetical protein
MLHCLNVVILLTGLPSTAPADLGDPGRGRPETRSAEPFGLFAVLSLRRPNKFGGSALRRQNLRYRGGSADLVSSGRQDNSRTGF